MNIVVVTKIRPIMYIGMAGVKCLSLQLVIVSLALIFDGSLCADVEGQNPVQTALYLGDPSLFNTTRDDCLWKRGTDRDTCPDKDIKMILYTSYPNTKRLLVDPTQTDWLRNSGWDPEKHNIILIHGYAGGDDSLPTVVLKDAYVNHGDYNVFMVDWGALCQPPCYVAAVHNLKPVSKCLALYFSFLRRSGMEVAKTTCVGHSLGAHICGLLSNYLDFRVERIIGLDPARPLIKPGGPNRLDSGDAKSVQVIHTNAGHYGEGGRIGHVDICMNGGRKQPYCGATTNANLCSHIWSVCYLAQSLFEEMQIHAEPCTRRCPSGPTSRRARKNLRFTIGNAIPIGQATPMNAMGSYCVKDHIAPFCPTTTPSNFGDTRCCVDLADLSEYRGFNVN